MLTSLFVLTRILANPLSNLFQKKLTQESADPAFIICVSHALLALASLPVLISLHPWNLSTSFWTSIFIAVLLAVASNILLVYALRTTDLSILGPINAYKSVVGLIFGIVMLHEIPTWLGGVGVFLILVGSYGVVDQEADQSRRSALVQLIREKGVRLRLAALVLSALEALFLKKALLVSSPLTTFIFWSVLGLPIAAIAVGFLLRGSLEDELAVSRRHKPLYGALAVTTGLMQLATVFTFGKLQVGYSLALFQTSSLISVFLGYKYFQEVNLLKRLGGSLVMVAGAVLIVLFGTSE